MLRISKLADYGTVVMVFLAQHQDQLMNARDISAQTHLSLATVSKLLKRLTHTGLLVSKRGSAGGYALKKTPAEISVANILYALDETRGLTECSEHVNSCALQHVCHVRGNWQLISRSIDDALSSVSLEALAKPVIPHEQLNQMKQFVMGVKRVESA